MVIDKNSRSRGPPIASITKLMTAMVILDRGLDLEQRIVRQPRRRRHAEGHALAPAPGTTLTRGELLLLALMASENRAAAALGRTYPGGVQPFVEAMNAKAAELGMSDSQLRRADRTLAGERLQPARPGEAGARRARAIR